MENEENLLNSGNFYEKKNTDLFLFIFVINLIDVDKEIRQLK